MSPATRSHSLFALQLLVVFGAYFISARWGLSLEPVNSFAALIWPATGISLAAVFIFGNRVAPAIALGAFLANYYTGAPLFAAFAIAAGNALEAVVGAWLLRAFRFDPLFNRLVDSFIFIVVALSTTVISATIGATSLSFTSLLTAADVPLTWVAWWIGDVLGALVMGPFLIRWLVRPPLLLRRSRAQFLESITFLAALILASVLVFWDPIPALGDATPAYLLFVPLTWGALRVGPRIMTLAIATLAAIAISGTFSGMGPFVPLDDVRSLFHLQLFLSTVAFIFLLFVAAVEERKETSRRLQENVVALREDMETISEADRAKNEFIATLSHELRNPLAPVLSTLEIMRTRGIPDSETRSLIDATHENVMRITRLLDDLLDVARISRKQINLRMGEASLKSIIAHSRTMAESLIKKNNHSLTVQLPEEDVRLTVDQLRIEQVVVNLLNNAAKYTPQGGRIVLSAQEARGGIEIRVRDNGLGIPQEELERIFEPFKQIGNRRENGAGLGIGLALARRLVELHGGTIHAESAGEGHGSEFIVWLPAAKEVILLPAAEASSASPARVRTNKKKILVVDDNAAASDAIAKLLNHSGHEAVTAPDGARALETLSHFRPDIILLDIGLPDGSGYDVARMIRRYLDPCPTLVALTGYGSDDDKQKSSEAGFDKHLVKPVSIADLEEVLAST